jgi:hypothetical protein
MPWEDVQHDLTLVIRNGLGICTLPLHKRVPPKSRAGPDEIPPERPFLSLQ